MQLAKAVASAAAALVLKAKSVAQRTEDSGLQTQVIAAATQCALSTSQLVACTKVSFRSLYPVPRQCGLSSHVQRLRNHFQPYWPGCTSLNVCCQLRSEGVKIGWIVISVIKLRTGFVPQCFGALSPTSHVPF